MYGPGRSFPDCFCSEPHRWHRLPRLSQARRIPSVFGPVYGEEELYFRFWHRRTLPIETFNVVDEERCYLGHASARAYQGEISDNLTLFCDKYCPLYCTVDLDQEDDREEMALQSWAAWFHHGKTSTCRNSFLFLELGVANLSLSDNFEVGKCSASTTVKLGQLAKLHSYAVGIAKDLKANLVPAYDDPGHQFLPSFERCFMVLDNIDYQNKGIVLVILGSKRRDEPGWIYEAEANLSWWRAPVGQVLEKLLVVLGLPPSEFPETMHKGSNQEGFTWY